MAALVIKKLPDEVHRRLKEQAERHHRSMTREAIVILERGLGMDAGAAEPPAPYKGEFPLTDAFIESAKRKGRE